MLKQIGTAARQELESFFGIKVFLALTVQVRRNWRKDDARPARVRLPAHVLTWRSGARAAVVIGSLSPRARAICW